MRSFFGRQEGRFEVGIREVGGYKVGNGGKRREEGVEREVVKRDGVIVEDGVGRAALDDESGDE